MDIFYTYFTTTETGKKHLEIRVTLATLSKTPGEDHTKFKGVGHTRGPRGGGEEGLFRTRNTTTDNTLDFKLEKGTILHAWRLRQSRPNQVRQESRGEEPTTK